MDYEHLCLVYVRDLSCAWVYTLGLVAPTASQHSIFDSEKLLKVFLVLLTGPFAKNSRSVFGGSVVRIL